MEKMKNTLTLLIGFIFFFSFIIIFCITSQGSILHVGSGQTYSNIQDAINAANESDTIYVYSGTYNENLIVDKTLVIQGYGSGTKTINGVDSNMHTIKIEAINVSISGFTIQNEIGSANHYSCIFLNSVTGCHISNNVLKKGENGVYLVSSNSNIINGNTIESNNQYGMIFSNSDNNEIYDNTIRDNGNDGIYLTSGSSSNKIYQNTITGNYINGVKTVTSTIDNIFYLNSFSDNGENNAWDPGSNTWYYNSQGNYWDDYTGSDSNNDGVGDTPYTIPGGGGNQDLYPLGYFANSIPVANIVSVTPNPATQGDTVYFEGSASDDGTIVNWEWTSNLDGLLSNSEDFSYNGLSVGTHTIKFRVQDNDGAWSSYDSITFTVNPQSSGSENQPPTAEISYPKTQTTVTYGENVFFSGTGNDPDGDNIVEYYWSSNLDGKLSTQNAFYKSDLSVGTHTITFKVKDNNGAWSNPVNIVLTVTTTAQNASDVNNPPVADTGGPYNGYKVGDSITFDGGRSYDPDAGDTLTYMWDFGDGTTSSGENVEHVYTTAGEYTVELTVTDSRGMQSKDTTIVTILSSTGETTSNTGSNNNSNIKNDKWVIPGFETTTIIAAIAVSLIITILWGNKRKQ